ncbi:hypothetical protein BVI1335_3040003 [Burkholderia vietnamiensis]|nr:hypothetical protein BVI1335_3040003 [Burkholderia vietnamiensis]
MRLIALNAQVSRMAISSAIPIEMRNGRFRISVLNRPWDVAFRGVFRCGHDFSNAWPMHHASFRNGMECERRAVVGEIPAATPERPA